LPRSHSHYKDFLDLRGDGRVVLYKRADHQNPKWTVRLKIPSIDGFVVKSTKTTDVFEARRFAEDLYYRLEGKARTGEPINSPTFRRVFTEWAKVPVAEQVVRSIRYVNGNVRRVEIWALRYFADVTNWLRLSQLSSLVKSLADPNEIRRSTVGGRQCAIGVLADHGSMGLDSEDKGSHRSEIERAVSA
jgi:hypothetical protein